MRNKKQLLLGTLVFVVVLLSIAIVIAWFHLHPHNESGTLTGYVVNAADNSPLRGVTVSGVDQNGIRYDSHDNIDTTGPDGFFSLELPPNDYKLVFEADDFEAIESTARYTVESGKTMEVQEALQLSAPSETAAAEDDAADSAEDDAADSAGEPVDEPGEADTADLQETVDLSQVLTFNDPALERAIRSQLELEEGQALTLETAQKVRFLDLSGGGKKEEDKISDITGLSAFVNLEELSLQTNHVSDIEELAGLTKLTKLQLESNNISDLTPLHNLYSLRKLEVASNAISDISPLFSLKQLEVLDVIENRISSIEGIGSMLKLNTLRLGHNTITDISPVRELRDLQHLSFGYNKVEDISVLYDLPMLHVLTLNGNQVKDIGPIAYMPELKWLEVAGNPIENTSILDNLPESVKHLER